MSEIDEALKALRWELEVPDAPAVNPAAVTNRINALIRAHVKAILSARPPTPEAERPAEKCHPWCSACRDAGCPDCSGSAPRESFECSACGAKVSGLEKCPICHPVEGRADCADCGCELRGIWCDNCEKPQPHAAKSDPSATSERTEDVRTDRKGMGVYAGSGGATGLPRSAGTGAADSVPVESPALGVARPTSGVVPDAFVRRGHRFVPAGGIWLRCINDGCSQRWPRHGDLAPLPTCTTPAPAEAANEGSDRERLGRIVRLVWVNWAREQANPKASWLKPWEELSEPDKEVDRRIGETLFNAGRASLAKRNALLEAFVDELEKTNRRHGPLKERIEQLRGELSAAAPKGPK